MVDTIWPMFGIANQLLAVVALSIAGTVIVNSGRARYLWVPVLPMLFVTTTTMTAGVELMQRSGSWVASRAISNVFLILSMMAMVVIILLSPRANDHIFRLFTLVCARPSQPTKEKVRDRNRAGFPVLDFLI